MRTPKTLKALLLSALFATAALGANASAAQVYFENNDSGSVQAVDVYVDGQLMFDDVSAGTLISLPQEIASGPREVVVTAADAAPGTRDLLRTTVNVESSDTYTLALDWATGDDSVREYSLDLTPGMGSV